MSEPLPGYTPATAKLTQQINAYKNADLLLLAVTRLRCEEPTLRGKIISEVGDALAEVGEGLGELDQGRIRGALACLLSAGSGSEGEAPRVDGVGHVVLPSVGEGVAAPCDPRVGSGADTSVSSGDAGVPFLPASPDPGPDRWSETGLIVGVEFVRADAEGYDPTPRPEGTYVTVRLDHDAASAWPMRVVVTKTDGAES